MTEISKSQIKNSENISLVQKYTPQYYCSLLSFAIVVLGYQFTRRIEISFAVLFIFTQIGRLLPPDNFKVTNSAYHNSHHYQIYPALANLAANWLTYIYLWHIYEQINHSWSSLIITSLCMMLLSTTIVATHELMHRQEWSLRIIAYLNLIIFQFTIYPVTHLFLHHKQVGSPLDPITPAKNSNPYIHALKAIIRGYTFNYQYSKAFFALGQLLNWSYIGVLWWIAAQSTSIEIGFYKALYFLLAAHGIVYFFQIVEYMEHYGLIYRQNSNRAGVTPLCAWNSQTNMYANWIGFRFQRHSDHHMNAHKVYPTLQLTSNMPMHPFCLTDAFVMVLIPPLWRYLINPLVDEVIEGTKITPQQTNRIKWAINISVIVTTLLLISLAYKSTI